MKDNEEEYSLFPKGMPRREVYRHALFSDCQQRCVDMTCSNVPRFRFLLIGGVYLNRSNLSCQTSPTPPLEKEGTQGVV